MQDLGDKGPFAGKVCTPLLISACVGIGLQMCLFLCCMLYSVQDSAGMHLIPPLHISLLPHSWPCK